MDGWTYAALRRARACESYLTGEYVTLDALLRSALAKVERRQVRRAARLGVSAEELRRVLSDSGRAESTSGPPTALPGPSVDRAG